MRRIFQYLLYATGGRLEKWPLCRSVWRFFLATLFSLIASMACAETIEISNDRGGFLFLYQQKWEKIALQHPNVRITGVCLSACTALLGYVPRSNICVTDSGVLGFHLATMEFATKQLWAEYPDDIQEWINKQGGLTHTVLWLQAPQIFHFFKKCPVG
jgi:hypothetical protein